MLDVVLNLDRDLFLFVNQSLTNDVFDATMPIITDLHRQPLFWAAVAAWIFSQILVPAFHAQHSLKEVLKRESMKWIKGILILSLSMGLADLIAYRGVKTWVQRDRPEAAGLHPTLRTHSHSGWSFPSNHAANNFALARTVQLLAPSYAIAAYIFAFIVALSRVYVGVHFPGDALIGALIGVLSASLVWRGFEALRRRRAQKESA